MRVVIFLIFSVILQAQSLSGLLNRVESNGFLEAKEYESLAKDSLVSSSKSSKMPTIDLAAKLSKSSPSSLFIAPKSASLAILLKYNIYDSSRAKNDTISKRYQYKASKLEVASFTKSLELKVASLYFSYYKARANIKALNMQKKALNATLNRVRKFKTAGLATDVEIDKIRAILEQNRYAKESINLTLNRLKEELKVTTNSNFKYLKLQRLKEPRAIGIKESDSILKLKAEANSLNYKAKSVESALKPQINLSYQYAKIKNYDTKPTPFGKLPNYNSKLDLSATLRVYDGGRVKDISESIRYSKLALLSKANQLYKEQKSNLKIAKLELKSKRVKLRAAKREFKAASSLYVSVNREYQEGLVDYIAYLDALTQKVLAKAKVDESSFDLELSKALIYHYSGYSLKGFLR